jgi:hypothetical protein
MQTTVTYEEFERAELAQAKKAQDDFAKARRQAVEEQIRQQREINTAERSAKVATVNTQTRAAAASFTADYQKNGLKQAVAKRQWNERLADLGLFRSGALKTATRRTAEQKAVADEAVSAEKQQKVDALAQSLSTWIQSQRTAEEESAAKLRAAAEKEIAQNDVKLQKEARARATNQYKAALSAAAKGVNAS